MAGGNFSVSSQSPDLEPPAESRVDFPDCAGDGAGVKADEIIAEIKGLSPEDFDKVSAFMLQTELEDPALQVALQRMQDSISGRGTSRPYHEVLASVRAKLAEVHAIRPAPGS